MTLAAHVARHCSCLAEVAVRVFATYARAIFARPLNPAPLLPPPRCPSLCVIDHATVREDVTETRE
jgi:hypothetical protein